MLRPQWLLMAFLGLAPLVEAPPAQAHPHVWIDAALRLDVAPDGRMRAVAVTWTFDELYSQVSVEGLDADGDGTYSGEELAPMIAEAMTALEEWRYFLSLRQGGRRLAISRAVDAGASFANGRLSYTFTVPLAEPVSLPAGPVLLRAFDPSFYIDIGLPEAAAVRLDDAPTGCAATITDPAPMEEMMLMSEAAALAAAPAPDDADDGLGGRFAQTVTLTCE